MASARQQRLFARAMELRLGEYLETYDDERASAVEEAYRNGDIDQVCLVCFACVRGGGVVVCCAFRFRDPAAASAADAADGRHPPIVVPFLPS